MPHPRVYGYYPWLCRRLVLAMVVIGLLLKCGMWLGAWLRIGPWYHEQPAAPPVVSNPQPSS